MLTMPSHYILPVPIRASSYTPATPKPTHSSHAMSSQASSFRQRLSPLNSSNLSLDLSIALMSSKPRENRSTESHMADQPPPPPPSPIEFPNFKGEWFSSRQRQGEGVKGY